MRETLLPSAWSGVAQAGTDTDQAHAAQQDKQQGRKGIQ